MGIKGMGVGVGVEVNMFVFGLHNMVRMWILKVEEFFHVLWVLDACAYFGDARVFSR